MKLWSINSFPLYKNKQRQKLLVLQPRYYYLLYRISTLSTTTSSFTSCGKSQFHCPLSVVIITQLYANRLERILQLLALTSGGAEYTSSVLLPLYWCRRRGQFRLLGGWESYSFTADETKPRKTSSLTRLFSRIVSWGKSTYSSSCFYRTGTTSYCIG